MEALSQIDTQSLDTALSQTYILGFDTETTGTAVGRDAIVSASLVLRNPAVGFAGDVTGYWEINPGQPINPAASKVNGFTDEYLQDHGLDQKHAITQIASLIVAAQLKNIPLLAYNAPFDVSMLNGDLKRIGLPDLNDLVKDHGETSSADKREFIVIDPLVIDRAVSKRRGKRTLSDTTFYYGVHPHGSFHDAMADTIAAVDLIEPMSRLYPQAGSIKLRDLMSYQRSRYNSWKENFNTWLASQGRTPVRGSWL